MTPEHHSIDISSQAFWDSTFDERERSFARLRTEAGPTWHAPLPADFPYTEPGFWAATTHQDIVYVSKNSELFTSAEGVAVSPMPKEPQVAMSFFLTMDPPEHTIFRKLIAAAFTPRQVKRIQHQIEQTARVIVDGLIGAGDVDFVSACSSLLPMHTVSDMIGIDQKDREPVRRAAEALFGAGEEKMATDVDSLTIMLTQVELLRNAAIEIAEARRRKPEDDLMTNIVQAEIDGHRLTNDQIGAFMILLSSAGNDTTKQTTSHAMLGLARNPEQREWLLADWDGRIGGAVEEFVRWASAVMSFSRRATRDTEIRGSRINAGDKVALFYCSGNRDASAFGGTADVFDITRNHNPHIGFGGGGVHYCLGSHVAKTQLRALFRELLTRTPKVEIGEPVWLKNTFVHGIKHLPAHFPA